MKTLGQIAYDAAAKVSFCDQEWADANQSKWEAAALAVAAAESEACAAIADARAMRCEGEAQGYIGLDEDEVTNLRSLAWQFSVLAAEMRKRSNVKWPSCDGIQDYWTCPVILGRVVSC